MTHRASPGSSRPGRSDSRMVRAVYEHQQRLGFPISVREFAEQIGISSTSVARYYLERLQRLGYVDRAPGAARSIHVLVRGLALIGADVSLEEQIAERFRELRAQDPERALALWQALRAQWLVWQPMLEQPVPA